MKVVLLLLCSVVVISGAAFGSRENVAVKAGVFETPLDHFSPTDNRRLRLNYEVNLEFFAPGGPLFFQTHFQDGFGDGNLHRRGLVHSLARQLSGALINSRFRYFGNNRFA